jgi:hypothetical protein
MDEARVCSVCGKVMIKRDTGVALMSYPAQYPWDWWCGCGHTEPGGVRWGKTEVEMAQNEWEQANA